jgi:phage antirepressor YoqD-like protein
MKDLTVIEHKNKRVLTTAQLAEGYGTDAKVISYNFNHNKGRYAADKHYYMLEGTELRAFREIHELPENVNKLYLWTEKGALLHAKSLNTDKAWEVYDYLVETYFRAKEMFNAPKTLSEALFLAAKLQKEIEDNQPLIAFAETAAQSKDSILIRELAKICYKNGIETGEKRLFKKLREWRLLMLCNNEPYQRYVDAGYFEVTEGTHETNSGIGLHRTTRVLPKGQQYIMNRLKEET